LVETALVITILLALTFGVMEYGHFVYTRHSLESASQRGARTAILSDVTLEEVETAVEGVMAASGYETAEYALDVAGLDDPDVTDVTVTISVVWGEVGIRPMGLISSDRAVQSTVTMRKEGP
jgi:Flp pilus assembly protein TadG